MRNFITKFVKFLDIIKKFAWNRVNEQGNVPRCGVVSKFSDVEVIALSAIGEVFGIDSENYLFNRLESEREIFFPTLLHADNITRDVSSRHALERR